MREIEKEDVEFRVSCLEEAMPVRGNATASGDPEFDREVEDEIIAKLDGGNPWAWCCVKVEAIFSTEDAPYVGEAYLGGCSYEDEDDFTAHSGYYEGLCEEALDDLNRKLRSLNRKLRSLERRLAG